MHRLVVAALVGFASGCAGPSEREQLKQFLQVVEGSLGHRYDDQLRDYSEDERKLRWRVLFFRDQVAAIDNYLGTQPRLTQRGRAAVDAIRRVCAEELKLYEGLVAEKRFRLTEAEEQRVKELRNEWQQQMDHVGRMIDGKE